MITHHCTVNICETCLGEIHIGDWPFCKGSPDDHIPGHGSIDLLPEAFEIDHNGRHHRVRTLSDIRAIERQSEKDAADGKGAQIAWRDFSQDRSNRDANSLGENPPQLTHAELRRNLRRWPVKAISESEAMRKYGK